jgi:Domain of unknown function (DUF4262)
MTGGDEQVRADIATYGWHVIKVLEDDEGPGFAFTIGHTDGFGMQNSSSSACRWTRCTSC